MISVFGWLCLSCGFASPFCKGGAARVVTLVRLEASGGPCLHRAFRAGPAFAIRRVKKAAQGLRRHTKPNHATQTTPKQQRQSCYKILQNFFSLRSSQSVFEICQRHIRPIRSTLFLQSPRLYLQALRCHRHAGCV